MAGIKKVLFVGVWNENWIKMAWNGFCVRLGKNEKLAKMEVNVDHFCLGEGWALSRIFLSCLGNNLVCLLRSRVRKKWQKNEKIKAVISDFTKFSANF